MNELLFLSVFSIGFILGYYFSGYKWSRNADDYRRIEFFGKLYIVLHHDDPIFNPSADDISRMDLGLMIRDIERMKNNDDLKKENMQVA